ncbi:hypothetical protein BJ165DRAFT_1407357 [Panaeolus papilionaceus]|nr:hypothetical protein BJ165DRAFT_1407357 [Panaeolus papilionaceus]
MHTLSVDSRVLRLVGHLSGSNVCVHQASTTSSDNPLSASNPHKAIWVMLLTPITEETRLLKSLESDACIILWVMSAAVGMCIIFDGCTALTAVSKIFSLQVPGPLSNETKMQKFPNIDTPSTNRGMHSQRTDQPQPRGIFLPIRKYPSAPHRNVGVYAGAKRFQSSHIIISSPQRTHQSHNPPLASSGVVSPHIAGWAQVADSVVGRHPHTHPLSTRVATQAEIDLISGHVHIPWAFKADPSRIQPTAVKVVPPVMTSQHAPFGSTNVLREVTNTNHGRDVWKSVPDPAKRLMDKTKPSRRPLGRPPMSIVAADLVEPVRSDIQ